MTKKEKVKNFVKEHKKEIIAFYSLAIVGTALGTGYCKYITHKEREKIMENTTVFNIPNLTVSDFGKVGEEMISKIDEVTKDTPVKGWRINY